MTIGDRIKARRLELGLSVDELAEKIGKHRTTIYRYESRAIEDMSCSVLIPVAKALNVNPAYLLGVDEKSNDNISLSDFERELIRAYRRAPESRREAVRALLGVVEDGKKLSASNAG